MKTNLKLLMIAFLAIMTACSPEDGKDGQDGEQGIQGEAGQNGQDGNANVITVLFENKAYIAGITDFIIPEITQDILDNGVVLGYLSAINNRWLSLPYNYGGLEMNIFSIQLNKLLLASNDDGGSNFRFVIIEGSAGNRPNKKGGKSAKEAIYEELEQAGVDINDYDAVANHYNIPN